MGDLAIFGGFMTIFSIIGFFLTVIWLVLPFVVFSIKGKVDRSYLLLEGMERRLTALEEGLRPPVAPIVTEREEGDTPSLP